MLKASRVDAVSSHPFLRSIWPHALLKTVAVALFFTLWLLAYDAVNAFAADPDRTIHLTRPSAVFPWIIQPWTAVIYILGGLLFPLAPFLYYRSWRGTAFVISCFVAGSLLSFATYLAWPLSMVRPEFTGSSLGEQLMRWVLLVDRPANCFPSLHAFFALLGAHLIARTGVGQRQRWFWWAFAAAVCVTTVTSGQHYFIDAPGGAAVALAAYTLCIQLVRMDPQPPGPDP
jgi:membrane-associated phospholipid phosphatase